MILWKVMFDVEYAVYSTIMIIHLLQHDQVIPKNSKHHPSAQISQSPRHRYRNMDALQ
jgi:hypothetical protein